VLDTHARTRRVVAVAVLIALATVACGSKKDPPDAAGGGSGGGAGEASVVVDDVSVEPEGDPVRGGTIVFGLSGETGGNWNPTAGQWVGSSYIIAATFYDFLMAYGEDDEVEPYLAESMTSNDDFTLWTITLRPGVTFHDGSPLDAEALKVNLDAQRTSPLIGPVMRTVSDIRIIDDLIIEVEMSQPWSTFPHLLTAQPGAVAAPSVFASDQGGRNPVGTGPFEFVSWEPDNNLVVERSDDYWQEGLPYLDGVEFRVAADETTRAAGFEQGQFDIIQTSDPGQIIALGETAANGENQIFVDDEGEGNETFVVFNTAKPPFDDVLAREAVITAVDTDAVAETVYDGLYTPARGIFRPGSPWYVETDYPTYDPERAQELADEYEAKYGEPLTFDVNILPTPEITKVAEQITTQLGEVGIEATPKTLEQTRLVLDAVTGNFESTGFILFGSRHPDRDYVFNHGSTTAAAPGAFGLNFSGMVDEEKDAAMDAARATDDRDEQIAQYRIVQERMAETLAFGFLVHNVDALVYQNDVFGLIEQTLPDGAPSPATTTPRLSGVWLGE
jgi:peptide/nickel transport system substrate-binding protein